jgi:pyruvate,water dikinase
MVLRGSAFRSWTEASEGAVDQLRRLQQLPADDPAALCAAAAQLRVTLSQVAVPLPVQASLREACQALRCASGLAVRSSGTLEDLPGASFAGQHDSWLGVDGEASVLEAVRGCWLSVFSDRAVLYRAHRGWGHHPVGMAVILQPTVAATASGVLFTREPVTGDSNRMVIEAVAGLGEALVSGKASPRRFVLDRTCGSVSTQPSSDRADRPSSNSTSNRTAEARAVDLEPHLPHLTELAQRVETLLGGPQDIEWAIDHRTVWLLQARPITAGAPVRPPSGAVWTRANICENLPEVLTPMSWSLIEVLLLGCFRPIFRYLGCDPDRMPWLGLFQGRAYLNLTLTERLLGGTAMLRRIRFHELLGGPSPDSLERHSGRNKPVSSTPRGSRIRLSKESLSDLRKRVLFRVTLWAQAAVNLFLGSGSDFLTSLRARVDRLQQTDLSALPDAELAQQIRGLQARTFPELESPVATARVVGHMGPGLACAVAAFWLARRWPACQPLESEVCKMASAEAGRDLRRLAELAGREPEVARLLLEAKDFLSARESLSRTPGGVRFLTAWDHFMARHGHHARGEFDAYIPRWLETPDYILGLARGFLKPLAEPERHKEDTGRPEASGAPALSQAPWLLLGLGSLLARKGRAGLAYRENVKSEAIRIVAFLRRDLLEASQRLHARGALADRQDVFFLRLEEMEELLAERHPRDCREIIVHRKAEHAALQRCEPSVVIDETASPWNGAGQELAAARSSNDQLLRGVPASPGLATGRARVILRADNETSVQLGEILVAPFTDPGWTPYFLNAAAIVVDIGGQLSHGSVVAREYGIPAVVNVGDATRRIRDGQWLRVDGHQGTVQLLS